MDQPTVIDVTRRWISAMVIGLNLCPFARRVFESDKIRYAVSQASNETQLLADLTRELQNLVASSIDDVETTLLIHPHVFADFLDYNDFLGAAEGQLGALELEGIIQIASFHPAYQFAGTAADGAENFTNRSPYPMLHLLREESFTQLAGDLDDLLDIPERNIATLRSMGRPSILEMLKAISERQG
jgi:hypothetical protein